MIICKISRDANIFQILYEFRIKPPTDYRGSTVHDLPVDLIFYTILLNYLFNYFINKEIRHKDYRSYRCGSLLYYNKKN